MLVIKPKPNTPIIIKDVEAGKEWNLHFYWQQDGSPCLAFNAPPTILITDTGHRAHNKGGGK